MAVVGDGAVVHFFYRDGSNIQYRKSTDHGKTFAAAVTIGTADEIPLTRAAAANGQYVHLFYTRSTTLYYLRSDDGGATWDSEVAMDTFTSGDFIRLAVVCLDDNVHVGWVRTDGTDFSTDGLFYARSTDNGATWEATIEPFAGTVNPARPAMAVANGILHLGWNDQRYGGTEAYTGQPGEAVASRSLDNGDTWETIVRLSNTSTGGNAGTTLRTEVSAGQDEVCAMWQDPDGTPGSEDIYFATSQDQGVTFGSPSVLVSAANPQEHVQLAQREGFVVAVWADYRSGSAACWYSLSDDGGVTWETSRLVPGSAGTAAPRMTVTDKYAVLIVGDATDTNYVTRTLIHRPLAPLVKHHVFALATSTGQQQITGLGRGWKAGIFACVPTTAPGTIAGFEMSVGFVSGTTRRCLTLLSENGPTTMDTARGISNGKLLRGISDATGPVLDYEVDFVSWDDDGFTLEVTNAPAGAYEVHCLLFGGPGLLASEIADITVANAATQDVTGLAAEYDVAFFFQDRRASTFGDDTTNMGSIGVAVNGSGQGAISLVDTDNVGTSQVKAWQRTDACIIGGFTGTSVAENVRGRVTKFNVDGLSLAWDTVTADGMLVPTLLLKGGEWWCGQDLQGTATGTKAQTGVGFTPLGLLLLSTCVAAGVGQTRRTAVLALGMGDDDGASALSAATQDAASTGNTDQRSSDTKVMQHVTTNATVSAEADLDSLDEDGYTLDWTTADATARESVVVAVGGREPNGKQIMAIL